MQGSLESRANKTGAFARILGPYLVIVPGVITLRPSEVTALAPAFFGNPALVWITGALMVFGGIFIIANHQFWRGASAIFVSLFGWVLALRGLVLLLAPQTYERLALASEGAVPLVRVGFGLIALIGLELTCDGWIARTPTE